MIVFLVALTLVSWACLLPMLRDDRPRLYPVVPAGVAFDVPDATFDSRGFT